MFTTSYKKKIVLFNTRLNQSGGGERFCLETVQALNYLGYETAVICYELNHENLFDSKYKHLNFIQYPNNNEANARRFKLFNPLYLRLKKRLWLRNEIKNLNPDLIICPATWSQLTELWKSTVGLKTKTGGLIFGSMFSFKPNQERLKYGLVFKKAFSCILEKYPFYAEAVPDTLPKMGIKQKTKLEIDALLKFLATRSATLLFVLSERNRIETALLYRKNSIVLKAAYHEDIFEFKNLNNQSPKNDTKYILSVCRLAQNKRVDLIIKAFSVLCQEEKQKYKLIIGGTGPERKRLERLVYDLGLSHSINFLNYVDDKSLWPLMSEAELFVCADIADFNISPLEALALKTPILVTSEMDLPELTQYKQWFYSALPESNQLAKQMKLALREPRVPMEKGLVNTLKTFTYINYAKQLVQHLTKQ